MPVATAKQIVREVLESLPDDCSLENVVYRLFVLQSVEEGERDADAGRLAPHDEVMQEVRAFLLALASE